MPVPNFASYVLYRRDLGDLVQKYHLERYCKHRVGVGWENKLCTRNLPETMLAAYRRLIPPALEQSIREISAPVVDRSVTIACMTTKELVTKVSGSRSSAVSGHLKRFGAIKATSTVLIYSISL